VTSVRADRAFAAAGAVVAAAAASLLVAPFAGALAALAASGTIVGLAAAVQVRRERARARRVSVAQVPLPARARQILDSRWRHWRRMPPAVRARFEAGVQVFLADRRISGVDVPLTDDLRLLVAASAVTLSAGWDDFTWDDVAEVLVYPADFDRHYDTSQRELSGQTHGWGTVILSAPSLLEGFVRPRPGSHVGLHEFAHVLDAERSAFDGVPVGVPESHLREWLRILDAERERLARGHSILDPYALESTVELFAVAVEAFFQIPLPLRTHHAELYALLAGYFEQDPAAWEESLAPAPWLTLPREPG
jgi:MtfA peptidase